MISQGIPSLISKEGFESWPELRDTELLKIVEWKNSEEVSMAIAAATTLSPELRKSEFNKLAEIISIENHCRRLSNLMRAFPQ